MRKHLVQMWVDPIFHNEVKILAAEKNWSIAKTTEELSKDIRIFRGRRLI